jgi:hypothetical protein
VEVKARLDDGFEADSESLRTWKCTQSHLGAVRGSSPVAADQLMIDEVADPEDPRREHNMTPYR